MAASEVFTDVDAGKWEGVRRAALSQGPRCLASGWDGLDAFLDGGLRYGELCEWGMPFGCGGRRLLMAFLAMATGQGDWILWVHCRPGLRVYPPAWAAAGVDLGHVRFAEAEAPVQSLKPAFLESFFRVVVLDAPANLTKEDQAFLARNARQHGRIIIVLRDHFLTPRHGNVWARLRLNGNFDPESGHYHVQVVRGLSPRQLAFRPDGRLAW